MSNPASAFLIAASNNFDQGSLPCFLCAISSMRRRPGVPTDNPRAWPLVVSSARRRVSKTYRGLMPPAPSRARHKHPARRPSRCSGAGTRRRQFPMIAAPPAPASFERRSPRQQRCHLPAKSRDLPLPPKGWPRRSYVSWRSPDGAERRSGFCRSGRGVGFRRLRG